MSTALPGTRRETPASLPSGNKPPQRRNVSLPKGQGQQQQSETQTQKKPHTQGQDITVTRCRGSNTSEQRAVRSFVHCKTQSPPGAPKGLFLLSDHILPTSLPPNPPLPVPSFCCRSCLTGPLRAEKNRDNKMNEKSKEKVEEGEGKKKRTREPWAISLCMCV